MTLASRIGVMDADSPSRLIRRVRSMIVRTRGSLVLGTVSFLTACRRIADGVCILMVPIIAGMAVRPAICGWPSGGKSPFGNKAAP